MHCHTQYTGTISLGPFPPGEYDLRATIDNGLSKAERLVHFSLQP
jgi:hypothetical protein